MRPAAMLLHPQARAASVLCNNIKLPSELWALGGSGWHRCEYEFRALAVNSVTSPLTSGRRRMSRTLQLVAVAAFLFAVACILPSLKAQSASCGLTGAAFCDTFDQGPS